MYFKLIMCFALLVVSSNVFGQVDFGFKAGVNFPSTRVYEPDFIMDGDDIVGLDKDNLVKMKDKHLTTFYLKGYSSVKLHKKLALEPGITLEGRGGKLPESEYTASFLFIGVPVNFSYYIPVKKSGDIIVSAGGYYGVNVGGEYEFVSGYEDNGESILVKEKIPYGKGEEFRRDDYGLNFGLGYKFSKGFLINTEYTIGLRNHGSFPGEKVHSKGLSIGIGYQI